MSADSYLIAIISLIVLTALLTLIFLMRAEHERVLTMIIIKQGEKEAEWKNERQHLLDRIQAPSYDVMKHHEVKIIKAKNNEKEPEKLEVM